MDNRILLGGAAVVVVVGAAFAGGYYINRPSAPPPVTQTLPQTMPAQPVETTPAPAATTAPVPAQQVVAAVPVVKKRRLPDYANGETAYGPPPPPPPPPPRDFEHRPNPFEGHFATFPMHHVGAGTLNSPLTWTAQTEFGNGHEADLRISLVVPTPPPGDRGEFWSKWSSRGGDDVMPDVTRGTPVVVAASASAVVAIDPQFLDLDAPAILTVNGRDGQRIYRSRDVAPARGESWNAQGVRWIFQPDADFFRMMRDGANVSVMLRSRMSQSPIAVPFSTDDLPPSLNGFERDLYMRMPGIAAAWSRARPGAPPPPPPQASNPPPFGGPGYGQPHGPMPPQGYGPPNAPPPSTPPAQQSGNGNGNGPGGHRHDHGAPNEASVPPTVTKPNPPPAATAPANPAPPSHPIAPPHAVVTPPTKPAPVVPPPAKPVVVPPAPPKAAAANPGVAMITAEVAAYRPPAENCGTQPPMPQTPGPSPERKQAKIWLKCRAQWIAAYKKSIDVLGHDAVKHGAPLQTVNGGNAVVATYMKAQGEFDAQKAVIKP